jgi:IS30 family transposase
LVAEQRTVHVQYRCLVHFFVRVHPDDQSEPFSRKRGPKPAKLDDPALCAKVTAWLEEFWSPQEIARRLRLEFPNDPTMHVSHETIYQSLFVQGRGELRRELARCLRSGRRAIRQAFVSWLKGAYSLCRSTREL